MNGQTFHRDSAVFLISLLCMAMPPDVAAQMSLNATYTWDSVAIGGGGYVTDVYSHPRQRDLIYIRTDVGGFYRWDGAGTRWLPLTDHFPRESSNYYGGEGLALDPTDPSILYIAAGKYGWSALPGTIFKSIDRGHTWKKTPIDLRMGGNEDHRWGGKRLVVDPFHPQIVLFGSRHDGLYRSPDGGASWQKMSVFPGRLQDGVGINSLAFSPKAQSLVFAAAFGDGVFVSEDAGRTWKRIEGGPSEVERLHCAADGMLYVTHAQGVKKYDGRTWKEVTPPGISGGFNGVSTDPRHPDDLLVAASGDRLRLFRSRDGGQQWKPVITETKSSVPWYSGGMRQIQAPAGLTFDLVVPGRVWITDWYATYHTDDINAEPVLFASAEKGHEEVVAFTLATPPSGMPLLSGVADVDGFAHKALTVFPEHGIGDYYGGSGPTLQDCMQIVWCPKAPDCLARVGGRRWNGTGEGALSSDGGNTWRAFPTWDQKQIPARIAVSASDPGNMLVLCLGNVPLKVTQDGGATWQAVAGVPEGMVPDTWNWTLPITGDGGKGGVFYATTGGTIYRSDDHGKNFTPISRIGKINSASLYAVPTRSGDLYCSAGEHGLYHSQDFGLTFHRVKSVNRSSLFALGKAAPGATAPTLYLYGTVNGFSGKREGIYRSTDSGHHWTLIQDRGKPIGDEPTCLAGSWQTFGLVFIGTNGRGIYYGRPVVAAKR